MIKLLIFSCINLNNKAVLEFRTLPWWKARE